MPTYTIKSGSTIEAGLHTGKIMSYSEVERGKDKWKYIDLQVAIDGADTELKLSVPAPKKGLINPKSDLGRLLAQFITLEENAPIDPEQILVGKEIRFQTTDNENGFSEILKETVKKK